MKRISLGWTVGLVAWAMTGASVGWAQTPQVEPADLSELSLDVFEDTELDVPEPVNPSMRPLPYFLAHLHELANAVRTEEPHRGFIDLHVWRGSGEQVPLGSRIMENVLSLAYFYATDRPWNTFYGDAVLRARLELALQYLLELENGTGFVLHWTMGTEDIASTAFLTKFVGETLVLLDDAPDFDPQLYEDVMQMQRRMLMYLFTSDLAMLQGRRYSNQLENMWPGALAYLSLRNDPEMEQTMKPVIEEARHELHSPAGFPYENHGTDWRYGFYTHQSNMTMAWHYARGTAYADWIRDQYAGWVDWLSYNAVPEPDGAWFVLNRAIETRTDYPAFRRLETPLPEVVPLARAFTSTPQEVEQRQRRIRAEVREAWPQVPPLAEGTFNGFGPYAFLHRGHITWHPTEEQRREAISQLPYMASETFAHQRVDDRRHLELTYVRRPGYYAVFNAGTPTSGVMRLGLGLFWHPAAGTLIQSQTRMTTAAWGVRRPDDNDVQEAGPVLATYLVDRQPQQPRVGQHNLPDGQLRIVYAYNDGYGSDGQTLLDFDEESLLICVDWVGPVVEQIPLLVPEDAELTVEIDEIRVETDRWAFVIKMEGVQKVERVDTDRTVADRQVVSVHVHGDRRFTYRMAVHEK